MGPDKHKNIYVVNIIDLYTKTGAVKREGAEERCLLETFEILFTSFCACTDLLRRSLWTFLSLAFSVMP